MVLRVNGLFGWIEANDRRSIVLFAGFLLALNVGGVLTLYVPLAAFDPDHAPVLAWGGYLARYVPLVTLAAAGVFALQMLWHVRSVRKLAGFDFVDEAEEPRLCRIVEPLAMSMGLPAPYVGVVASRALNAFACGTSRRDAVVVVTRGLVDELDDDELAAVVAHELAHVANGDIRLLAAANACLRIVGWTIRPRPVETSAVRELAAFPVVVAVMPPLFLFIIAVSFAAESALKCSHLIRLLIASSREYVADARAVEVTQNPSALVSALERIQGRSRIAGLPPGQDAMMIDGATEGAFATHPTIAQRIAAIVAVTGSMAFVAPARRDTRPAPPAAAPPRAAALGAIPRRSVRHTSAFGRIGRDDPRNWLGLTPNLTVSALLGLVVFAGLHWRDLGHPGVLAQAIDPRGSSAFMAVATRGTGCGAAVLASLTVGTPRPERCSGTAMHDFMVAQAGVAGPVGALLTGMTTAPDGEYVWPDGHFSNVPPPDVEAAEVRDRRCFRTPRYAPGDRGWHRVDDAPGRDGSFDIRRWLARTESLAGAVLASSADRDARLKAYLAARKTDYETIHHFFGEPGLALARQAFASAANRDAVRLLGERLAASGPGAPFSPVERAEAALLVEGPDAFVSCVAREMART